jgi:hypothetical protein
MVRYGHEASTHCRTQGQIERIPSRRAGRGVDRAALPMPTELGTLDAIHLASSLLWQDATGIDLTMATHDRALGVSAQAHGLNVIGIQADHLIVKASTS